MVVFSFSGSHFEAKGYRGYVPHATLMKLLPILLCATRENNYSLDISTGLRLIASISAIMLAAIRIKNAGW